MEIRCLAGSTCFGQTHLKAFEILVLYCANLNSEISRKCATKYRIIEILTMPIIIFVFHIRQT